ncbi:hypothetical protein SAMN02910456_02207 [Ruminococcaceae bacterium YRB3002]|nr:hypothetical protein SAMN02910456_02207 [Ruminococcaceae bacterium YRB3002]
MNITEGVTFEGASLSLKSETTLSLYFRSSAGVLEFSCSDGKTVEKAAPGNYQVARIRGIKASELGKTFTLTVTVGGTDYTVNYGPMIYCHNVLNGDYETDLKNMCKALYIYWFEADRYFN